MTPSEFLLSLAQRGVMVKHKGGRVRFGKHAYKLATEEDRAFLKFHQGELKDLIPPGTDTDTPAPQEPSASTAPTGALSVCHPVDAILADEAARLDATAIPPADTRPAVFRTRRGFLTLRGLNPAEARDLYDRGKLSAEELAQWADWRRFADFSLVQRRKA